MKIIKRILARDIFVEKGHAPFIMLKNPEPVDPERFLHYKMSVVIVEVDEGDSSVADIKAIDPYNGETPSTEYCDGSLYFFLKK